MSKTYADVLGSRGELTEAECWAIEKIIRRVGHLPLIDAVANLIEPHVADTDAEGYLARQSYARTIRTEAVNLPDTTY